MPMKMSEREMQNKLEQSLTVADLIDQLEDMDPDAPVLFVCNYGDYHRTQQALMVGDAVAMDTSQICDSAYSNSGLALVESESDPEYWCQACEEETVTTRCPKCHERCVDEAGNKVDEDDDDHDQIVILR